MALQQALLDLDAAYKRFFSGQNRRPRFRSRNHWRPSFRIPQDKNTLQVQRRSASVGRLKLPKLGWINFRFSRPLLGEIRSVTLSRDSCGDWFVAILCRTPAAAIPEPAGIDTEHFRGIDLGVVQSVAPDNAKPLKAPTPSPRDRSHAAKLARSVSRKQKGSNNRAKAQHKLNKLRRRWRRRRQDFHQKLSSKLIRENQGVAVEDLTITQMTRRAVGKRVRQKSGLNRSILSQSWGSFRTMLEWKGQAAGVIVERIDPAYTSQRCSCCGVVDATSRRSQAVFECTACGHTENADTNAALRGTRTSGRPVCRP